MIRLDTRNNEKEQIQDLLGSAIDNPEYELECLFNNSNNRSQYNITHTNFISLLKRFKNHPEFDVKTDTRLAVTFPESTPFRGVRILIKGNGAVNAFCNSDSISQIQNSIDFEMKTRPRTKLTYLVIPNYDMKFNLKQEVNFNNDAAKIKDITRDWASLMKNYRYKKTFSFIKKTAYGADFQVDISIVKSSTTIDRFLTVDEVIKNNLIRSVVKPVEAKMSPSSWWHSIEKKPNEKVLVRDGSSFYKNIKESNVFNNTPTYEVEVEYIRNKNKGERPRFKNIEARKEYIQKEFMGYFKLIGSVLQCIQGTAFIMSNEECARIRREFTKTVLDSVNQNLISAPGGMKSKQRGGGEIPKNKDSYEMTSEGDIDFSKKIEQVAGETKIISGSNGDNGSNGGYNSRSYNTNDGKGESTEDGDDNSDDDIDNDSDDGKHNYARVDSDVEAEAEEIIEQTGGAGNVRLIADMKNRITTQFRNRGIFFGPLIVDLSHSNATRLDPDALPDIATNTNIQINYLVTDKTDGDRHLLYIDGKGAVYGIDRENNIKSFGLTLPSLQDTILDGELVTRSVDGKPLNNFYIFDAYIYQGECIMNKPFLLNKPIGRHSAILAVVKYFETGNNIIQTNGKMPFLLYKKDYLAGNSAMSYTNLDSDEQSSMQLNCERLLNKMNREYGGFLEVGHLFPYKTDGLVFLPNNLGVFQTREGAILKTHPFLHGRWNLNYKWKPADLLTIDFRVDFATDVATGKMAFEYRGDNKYIWATLKCAVYQNRYGDNNALNFYLLNSGIKLSSIPSSFEFLAVNPFVGNFDNDGRLNNNMSNALFRVDGNDNVVTENGDIIANGQIVECAYNRTIKDERMRWSPHRVRADKSAPNNYLTASTSWHLINHPITKESVCGKTITSAITGGIDNSETNKSNLADVTYYSDNTETVFLTDPLNNFNNRFVKRYLINRALTGYVRPRVMDLACGKMGDLFNYVSTGTSTFLGVEIGYDGLNNPMDGAATRIMNTREVNPAIDKLAERMILVVGDVTKNIANGECVRDNINKYYLDVLYGNLPGNTPKLKRLEGVAREGFDCVACMYAIHYMLSTESSLDGFLRNVAENLLDQGYFIGTCLDGMAILREMGSSQELAGVIGDKTVFKIKKVDDSSDAYKDITTGNKIQVYYEKFAGQFIENLVNMSYLREKAKEHNLKLIEYRTFLEEPGNLLSQFESEVKYKKEGKRIRDTEALMTWAGFNAYFIFQKVRE